MAIMKKMIIGVVFVGVMMGSANLTAISAQDKKKVAERKAKRKQEKTKGKAVAKPQSVKKPLAAKRQPVQKEPVYRESSRVRVPVSKEPRVVLPEAPMIRVPSSELSMIIPEQQLEPVEQDVPMPTDMPSRLIDALIAMVPNNLKNRIETIIVTFSTDAQAMFKNIYLLCWIDDELMKIFDTSNFYTMLLAVISQECDIAQTIVEGMATDIKNNIDTTLVRFENAIVAGDMDNFEIQSVQNLFTQQDSYREYLNRCIRLATEYGHSKMVTVLKLALANVINTPGLAEEGDFDY